VLMYITSIMMFQMIACSFLFGSLAFVFFR
jgi:hypothetical protein